MFGAFVRRVNILTLRPLAKGRGNHDDVIKWKHFPRYWPFVTGIHRSTVDSHHKGQWRGALMFYFICAWTNGWENNRDAGDWRRRRDQYEVTVMDEPAETSARSHIDGPLPKSRNACLCQSIEINNNKYVYRQSQVRKPIGNKVEWAECLLIIGTGCRVQVFSLILDSSVGLSAGIQSAGE